MLCEFKPLLTTMYSRLFKECFGLFTQTKGLFYDAGCTCIIHYRMNQGMHILRGCIFNSSPRDPQCATLGPDQCLKALWTFSNNRANSSCRRQVILYRLCPVRVWRDFLNEGTKPPVCLFLSACCCLLFLAPHIVECLLRLCSGSVSLSVVAAAQPKWTECFFKHITRLLTLNVDFNDESVHMNQTFVCPQQCVTSITCCLQ